MTEEATYVTVRLEWYEAELAAYVGARRQLESLKRGSKENTRHSTASAIDNHVQSAGAEKAVAKRLNIDWGATINTFQSGPADCGRAVEVRWRRMDYELKVRQTDADDRYFILARGEMPEYILVGWIQGRDAKKAEWLKDPGGYGKPNYFVPDDLLRPMSELRPSLAAAIVPEVIEEEAP